MCYGIANASVALLVQVAYTCARWAKLWNFASSLVVQIVHFRMDSRGNPLRRCLRCNLDFEGIHTYCCKHCRDGRREHGRHCTVRLTCSSCSRSMRSCEGKYINRRFYCCGHCEGFQRNPVSGRPQHSERCSFYNVGSHSVAGNDDIHQLFTQPPAVARPVDYHVQSVRSRSRSRHIDRCSICKERQVQIACVPCGHYVLCQQCSEEYMQQEYRDVCPICRRPLQFFMRIYGRWCA